MKPKISLITLGVADISRSREFYQKLGFPLKDGEDTDSVCFFMLEGTWLGLYPVDKLAEDAEISSDGSGFRRVTLAHNVGSEKEVDVVMQEALDAGAKLIKKPQKVFWGGYSGYFSDPDEHLWEVAYNPFFDLT